MTMIQIAVNCIYSLQSYFENFLPPVLLIVVVEKSGRVDVFHYFIQYHKHPNFFRGLLLLITNIYITRYIELEDFKREKLKITLS